MFYNLNLVQSWQFRTDEINNEADVQQAYEIAVATHCAVVAGTLEFELKEWCRSSLRWNKVRLSAVPEGLTAAQAIPDGYLNVVGDDDKYMLTPRERNILKYFPVIAIWEFKNLNFDSRGRPLGEKVSKQIFQQVADDFLDDLFPWEECDKGEQCPVVHPNVGVTAVRMGNDAEVPPCHSYTKARTKLPPNCKLRPKVRLQRETQIQKSARWILQQSWAEAVANDVTFLVIQAGNTEIIGIRDRISQTLFISDILEISSREHPYRKLHTGLYIAAIRDAEDRARSISMGNVPETWTMRSGIDEVHRQNSTGFKNKEVVMERLLKHAQTRTWLNILPDPSVIATSAYQPYTTKLYQRMERLPKDFHKWYLNSVPDASLVISDGVEMHLSLEDSQVSVDIEPMDTAPSGLHSQVSSSNEITNVGIATDTFFQLYAMSPFHGVNVCRAKLEIPGVKYHSCFKDSDKPRIILENAIGAQKILRLEKEFQTHRVLESKGVVCLPRVYGFFVSLDLANLSTSCAALLLEDRGPSLSYIRSTLTERFRIHSAERVIFNLILNQIHDAGYLHGNLTSECLLLDHSRPGHREISVVGFGHAISQSSGLPKALFEIRRKEEEEKLKYLLSLAGQKAQAAEREAQRTAKKMARESDRKAHERQLRKKILYPKRQMQSPRKGM
ncbi:hypothetical protein E4T56_gene4006 [Termitomyces sp. T112]|nr:hypothetical protein E4T56_gene4006 [Termitomyces sp. T112]